MTQESPSGTLGALFERLAAGFERLLREIAEEASNEALAATATELWEVVTELEDVLETIDFEGLPDAVEVSALPDLVDVDELPSAISEADPDLALNLGELRRVIKLRALWNAVDLVDFSEESRQLSAELKDVLGPDAFESSGDSEAADDLESFTGEIRGEATNAAFQQELKKRIETGREAVIDAHATFEELYESTSQGTGYAGRKPSSNNPTAVSSMPVGPLPASVSTRVSTVPTDVRLANVDGFERVYGRRWRRASKRS
jgi:hypothetical protein